MLRNLPLLAALVLATAAVATENGALVAVRKLAPGAFDVTLPVKVGLLAAGEHRDLAFEVAGTLVTLAAEGTPVAAGEPIAAVDADLEIAQRRQADLHLREARSELRRVRGLRARGAASEKALESADTNVALRVAEVDVAAERLVRRRLLAPFDGVVAETRLDPGEVVSPGAPVVSFMALDFLRLEVGVPGYQIGEVAPGADVLVTVPALPGKRFDGQVHRVAPAAPEGRFLFEVEIRVPNKEGQLRAGMSARASIVTASLGRALVLPLEASVVRDGERVVFFVADDRARAISVEHAPLHGDGLVLEPPPPFTDLVVRGQRDLRDGMRVRIDQAVLAGPPADGVAPPVSAPSTR